MALEEEEFDTEIPDEDAEKITTGELRVPWPLLSLCLYLRARQCKLLSTT